MQGRKAYATIGLALAFLLGVYFVYPIRVVVLVFLLTLLLSTIMSAPVNYLARQGMPRVWGTLAVFVGLLLGLQLVVEFVIAPLLDQTQRLLADFPALLAEVRNFINWLEQTTRLDLAEPLYAERLLEAAQDRVSGLSVETVASAGYSIANIVYLVVVVLLTSVYVVLQPAPLVRGFVSLFPAGRRQQVREMLHKMYWNVQRWLLGQFADKMIVGLLIGLGLWVVGIPFALLLGILTGSWVLSVRRHRCFARATGASRPGFEPHGRSVGDSGLLAGTAARSGFDLPGRDEPGGGPTPGRYHLRPLRYERVLRVRGALARRAPGGRPASHATRAVDHAMDRLGTDPNPPPEKRGRAGQAKGRPAATATERPTTFLNVALPGGVAYV
jgi:hypothetical protein